MNRSAQTAVWLVAGPVFGLLQGVTSFLPVLLTHGLVRGVVAEVKAYPLISLVHGCYWLLPGLLLSDWIFLRRVLKGTELTRYFGIVGLCALLLGLVLPGFALMIGYPLTALVILGLAVAHRKR